MVNFSELVPLNNRANIWDRTIHVEAILEIDDAWLDPLVFAAIRSEHPSYSKVKSWIAIESLAFMLSSELESESVTFARLASQLPAIVPEISLVWVILHPVVTSSSLLKK